MLPPGTRRGPTLVMCRGAMRAGQCGPHELAIPWHSSCPVLGYFRGFLQGLAVSSDVGQGRWAAFTIKGILGSPGLPHSQLHVHLGMYRHSTSHSPSFSTSTPAFTGAPWGSCESNLHCNSATHTVHTSLTVRGQPSSHGSRELLTRSPRKFCLTPALTRLTV